jgi:ABC-type branched-subunit amino acid transport system ATPase component
MITRIEAYRYKCFERLQLDVSSYQVLVGRNGAGKTTLLDIPILIGEMLESRSIAKAFFGERERLPPRAVTAQDLIFGNRGDWFAFALEVRIPEVLATALERKRFEEASKKDQELLQKHPGRRYESLRYEISFRADGGALAIIQEHLFLLPHDRKLIGDTPDGLWGDSVDGRDGIVQRIIGRDRDGVSVIEPEVGKRSSSLRANLTPLTPALSGAPADLGQYAATDWLRNHLGRDVLPVNLNLAAMREPQLQRSAGFPISADGTTLPASVKELQKHPAKHEEWITHLSGALPLLQNVNAREQEADKRLYLEVNYRTGHTVNSIVLSDGTFSLFALSILPFLDRVPALVMVEEPENGIHPKAIEVILESLQVIDHSQVWVTTHSPIVVAVTKPEHLICLSMTKNEGVKAVRGDQHDLLSTWRGIPTLDVLFSAGVL